MADFVIEASMVPADLAEFFEPVDDALLAPNVWHLGPEPCSLAHFATMPATLAERCIKAGTSEKGQCPHCAAPWVRVVERESSYEGKRAGADVYTGTAYATAQSAPRGAKKNFGESSSATIGWSPSCSCPGHDPVPQTVLDPFAGAGTSLLVADRLQRDAVGIELNAEYCALIRKRLAADAPLFTEVA